MHGRFGCGTAVKGRERTGWVVFSSLNFEALQSLLPSTPHKLVPFEPGFLLNSAMQLQQRKERDWAAINKLTFKRGEKLKTIFELLYLLLAAVAHQKHHARLRLLIDWLKVPLTLWAVPVDKIATHAAKEILKNKPADPQFDFLMELMDNLPGDAAMREISAFEQFVYEGKYEILLRGDSKYAANLKALKRNPLFQKHVTRFNELFPFEKFQNEKGILRRTLVPERNLRSEWEFCWTDERKKAQLVLDAICHYWLLYGFEKGEPLLLKPSVNPTPHGIMIFIPAYWNLNPWTDLDWSVIRQLIQCRARAHRGHKRTEANEERLDECLRTLEAYERGMKKGYTSERLRIYVNEEARLHANTDTRQIYRNRKIAESYWAENPR